MSEGVEGQDGSQGGGEGGGGTVARDWMQTLPDDLKGNALLARYETPEQQLRGHLEARTALANRVAVPGEGADQATRDAFYKAIGRPDTADGYAFKLAEGADDTMAKAFGAKAFEMGMPKDMAEKVVAFNDEMNATAMAKWRADGEKEVADWKAATPDADAKIASMQALFKRFGGDEATAAEVEARLGTGKMLDLFAKIAAATGEHGRVDGAVTRQPGKGVDAANVEAQWDAKMGDAAWRAKVAAGDADAVREYNELVAARREAAAQKMAHKNTA